MEELLELRQLLVTGKMPEALLLLDEMDEMAKDDKINKIESHLMILLQHLINQAAEKRITRSWEVSIANAISSIKASNKRRKAGGFYLTPDELREATEEACEPALRRASLEAFEGHFDPEQLAGMVDGLAIRLAAMQQLAAASAV